MTIGHEPPEEEAMVGRRAFLIGAMLAFASCVSTPATTPVPSVYVMRHLNTPKGTTDPDLTPEGLATAEALAGWLSRDPPIAIFVSNTKRAMQTAAPTSRRFGVNATVYNPANTSELLTSVLAQQGTVLVVGHSNTVPDIIAGLGGEKPAALVHEDFGDIWHVQGAERRTTKAKLPLR
jgi:broad specificity phosphatase PhoE